MGKPTPGPWEQDGGSPTLVWAEVGGVDVPIADASLPTKQPDKIREAFDQARANARLIAAAPELLEVVELIAALDIEDENVGALGLDDAVVAARAAIAKARGEQP